MKTKLCQSFCGRVLKLSEFPPNKKYGKKRHPYCRACCSEKMRRHREVLKAMPQRKESIMARMSPAEKVISAIRNGKHTQRQIRCHARLTVDRLGDVLVQLILDERKVKSEVVDGERLYFERIAA